MALTESTQIYRDCYQMLKKLVQIIEKYPNKRKHLMGDRQMDSLLRSISNYYRANESYGQEKLKYLKKMRREFNIFSLLLRLSCEMNDISYKRFAELTKDYTDIGRQMTGLIEYFSNNSESQNAQPEG